MSSYLLKAYLNTSRQIDILNATHDVKRALRESQAKDGLVTVFVPGSTASVAILENDPTIHEELKKLIASFVVDKTENRPERKSGSGRIEAHLRASFFSTSVTIPVQEGRLLLGPWQEVLIFDFDDKPARREFF